MYNNHRKKSEEAKQERVKSNFKLMANYLGLTQERTYTNKILTFIWLKTSPTICCQLPCGLSCQSGMLREEEGLLVYVLYSVFFHLEVHPLGSQSILQAPSVSSQAFTKGHHHQKPQTDPQRKYEACFH